MRLIDESGTVVIAQAGVYDARSYDYSWGVGYVEGGPYGWTADPLPLSGSTTLQIRVSGDYIEVYFDGELIVTGETTLRAGEVRLDIWNYDEPPGSPHPFGTISLDQYQCTDWAGPCPGDLDGDDDLDIADLARLLAAYGVVSGATYADGDLDGDGDVDLSDLAILLGSYGATCD